MKTKRRHSKVWPFGDGEPLDMRTLRGALSALLVSCLSFYIFWNIDAFFSGMDEKSLFGVGKQIFGGGHPVDPDEEGWHRLWAVVIGGSGIVASIIAIVMIPFNRRAEERSADEDIAAACHAGADVDVNQPHPIEAETQPPLAEPSLRNTAECDQ